MICFGFAKIMGLFLFFIGMKILSRRRSMEKKARLKRQIHETPGPVGGPL